MVWEAWGPLGTNCLIAHPEASGSQNLENWLEVAQPLAFPAALSRFDVQGKGAIVARTQDFGCLLDSITVCLFLSLHQWVQPSHYTALLNHAVGWDLDKDEFLLAGERIFNLKRMISVRRGISRKDDTLLPRILTHRLPAGGTKGNLPFLGLMLNEYYAARGWSEEGIPTREKLLQLDLRECL